MSLNDPNVKKVTITSEAAESLSPKVFEKMNAGDPNKKKSRKIKKKFTGGEELIVNKLEKEKEKGNENEKTEGGGTHPGTLDQLASSHVPGSNKSKAVGIASRFTADSAPVGKLAPSSGLELKGGSKVKVILSKTQKKSKVILGPAKAKTHATTSSKHKKTAKKVNVSLSGLTRKLHKAKRIHNGVTKQTIEEVKKALEKAGLIKEDSKAPEDILRRMYSDYMVLKKRAL